MNNKQQTLTQARATQRGCTRKAHGTFQQPNSSSFLLLSSLELSDSQVSEPEKRDLLKYEPSAWYPQHSESIDDLPVRIRFIIKTIWWTGLALWDFEFPLTGSLISTFR
jgi:hypothetical protein